MPFSGALEWHCSGCAAVNGSERESCFACGQARRADNDEVGTQQASGLRRSEEFANAVNFAVRFGG